jgi:glycine dehydrogenase subunit 2
MNPTIFDVSRPGVSGSAVQDADFSSADLGPCFPDHLLRKDAVGLPELTEVEAVRHYMALSRDSHGVDNGVYPLGSCTMKYNPKRNDVLAQLDGFANVHPHQPDETMEGVWELLYELGTFIAELMGMDHVTLQPAAGAHGELTGLLIIRAYFEAQKEVRRTILIQDSAHGTNPASAAMAGFRCKIIPTTAEGQIDLAALEGMLDGDVAAVMLTNPSTLGLFETRIQEVADKAHANGSLLYYDGANMNALMGIVRPGDMGFDVVHINTHKTLSTPHGAGGPGAGPVGVKALLEPFLPVPVIQHAEGRYLPVYHRPASIGPVKAFYGHIAILIRAYCYILTCGAHGLRAASENAVLNANYVQARLAPFLPPVYDCLCMHEALLNGERLQVNSFDFAKRLIDHGLHPPTLVGAGCVYFPNDLKSAMLIEPTETETKESLDAMIDTFIRVVMESASNPMLVQTAPHTKGVGKIVSKAARRKGTVCAESQAS